MSLDTFNVMRPGQIGGTGAVDATHIEEFTGAVEGTIERLSELSKRVPVRVVRGTSTVTQFGVGESTLQTLTPGVTPNGVSNVFGKITLQVDTVILARTITPKLDVFQTEYDSRVEVGREHGKKIAKFTDQAFFIMGAKTAALSATAYQGLGGAGHFGGTTETLAAVGDEQDPAELYAAILKICTTMEESKDVDMQGDDITLYCRPGVFNTLIQNEQLINSNYITSSGNSIQGYILKANGLPVVKSNNVPNTNVTAHPLSNAGNSNGYNGNFTKLVMLALGPRAIMAGATIPLETNVFYDNVSHSWYIDALTSFAVGPNRAEFAAAIMAA